MARTAKQVVKAWVEAFNRRDALALCDLYHPDATNLQVADEALYGREAIERSYVQLFQAFPDLGFDVVNLFQDGEWAILEWSGWGTQLGEFAGAPPSGKSYTLVGCGFFHVKEGKIAFQRGYWDKLSWFSQLGIPLDRAAR